MDENIKDLIEIPDALDKVILKGFQEGKRKKKIEKRKKIFKGTSVAAAIVLVSITAVGIINPKVVSAIPIINRAFDYFTNTNYKNSIEKYKELGEVINKTVEKDGAKVTLEEFILDDNNLVATIIVESEALRGYEEIRSPGDFFNLDLRISINGQSPKTWSPDTTIINDTKGAVILTADISDMNLEGEIKIDLKAREITRGFKTIAKGPWEYNIITTKTINSKEYKGDKTVKLTGGEVWVDKLVITPVSNKLIIKGKTESGNNDSHELSNLEYGIKDDKGNLLLTDSKLLSISPTGDYTEVVEILSDLTNVEYIELVQLEGGKNIRKEMNKGNKMPKDVLNSSSKLQEENKKEEFITRKPTKEELGDGYGLSSVDYLVNINKEKDFMFINELVGKVVKVNNNDSVTITGIEATDKQTKINMKIHGTYDYNYLWSLVIFDEDMNDTTRWEGHRGPVIENPETNEFSMTLGSIDTSNKYTVALPMTTELEVDETNKITIKLK